MNHLRSFLAYNYLSLRGIQPYIGYHRYLDGWLRWHLARKDWLAALRGRQVWQVVAERRHLTRLDLWAIAQFRKLESMTLKQCRVEAERLLAVKLPETFASVVLDNLPLDDEQLARFLRQNAKLASVDLDNMPVTAKTLEALAGRTMYSLGLNDRCVTSEMLDHLASINDLEVVGFRKCKLATRDLAKIVRMSKLKWLFLDEADCDDDECADVPMESPLFFVSFRKTQLGDRFCRWLATCPTIDTISADNSPIGNAGIAALRGHPTLKAMMLGKNLVDMGALEHFAAIPHLSCLSLSDCQIHDGDFSSLQTLTELTLSGCQISDRSLASLARLSQLRSLSLDNTKVTDAGLAALKESPQLNSLDLSYCQITDAGAAILAEMPQLVQLGLNHTAITDRGAAHLATLKELYCLSLQGTQVTRQSRPILAVLPKMERLYLPQGV